MGRKRTAANQICILSVISTIILSLNVPVFSEEFQINVQAERVAAVTIQDADLTNIQTSADYGNHHHHKEEHVTEEKNGCKLYLAPSSIEGAGLGIYTASHVSVGEVLTKYDIPIQVIDLRYHHNEDFDWLLDQYYWSSTNTDGHYEGNTVSSALPSFGMAGNGHMGLKNVDKRMNTDDNLAMLHRKSNPGAGAVTDYHTTSWYAIKDIPKGSEIFLDYGEKYFETREIVYGMIPYEENFVDADKIANKFNDIMTDDDDLKNETKQKLWHMVKDIIYPRTSAALPEDVVLLDNLVEKGAARLSLPNSIRRDEWLEENGQCMDNLRISPSTLPEAGRGAFTTRLVRSGSVIAPVPLVQILDRRALDMYQLIQDSNDGLLIRKDDNVVGQQLLLNYCFGHPESSLLLFPYSTAVQFINHDSERYNAKISWSENPHHHSQWMNTTIDEMHARHSGLMFDLIATKEILPGEEVFIDYGKTWERAWNNHVSMWERPADAEEYTLPEELNKNFYHPVRTIDEQDDDPYPYNVETACYYIRDENRINPIQYTDSLVVEARWYFEEDFLRDHLRPCTVLARYDDGEEQARFLYRVRMHNHGKHSDDDIIPQYEEHYVFDIPHHAIWFIDRMYTSNMHLRNAFRHELLIPDEMFPNMWKNRRVD